MDPNYSIIKKKNNQTNLNFLDKHFRQILLLHRRDVVKERFPRIVFLLAINMLSSDLRPDFILLKRVPSNSELFITKTGGDHFWMG